MKVKEFVNELKYYQMFLGEVISAYYINEAICDFAEQKNFSFASYGNCLGQISSALIRSQFVLCDILLRNSTQSKCIPRTIERIFNEPFGSDKKLKEEIQSVLCVVKDELNKIECDLKELGEYRNNVYAHFNNNIFSETWQEEFKKKHPFDYDKIIDVAKKCLDCFSVILTLLEEEPYLKSIIKLKHVQKMIEKLS